MGVGNIVSPHAPSTPYQIKSCSNIVNQQASNLLLNCNWSYPLVTTVMTENGLTDFFLNVGGKPQAYLQGVYSAEVLYFCTSD